MAASTSRLQHALALKAILDQAVQALNADLALPERQPPADMPKIVRNLFV
jgi:hypothetical protein